jgi:hypothetical protein
MERILVILRPNPRCQLGLAPGQYAQTFHMWIEVPAGASYPQIYEVAIEAAQPIVESGREYRRDYVFCAITDYLVEEEVSLSTQP